MEGSVLSTILLLTAFSIGVFSSSFLRAAFGLLLDLNQRKTTSVKILSNPDELPKLPDSVRGTSASVMNGGKMYPLPPFRPWTKEH